MTARLPSTLITVARNDLIGSLASSKIPGSPPNSKWLLFAFLAVSDVPGSVRLAFASKHRDENADSSAEVVLRGSPSNRSIPGRGAGSRPGHKADESRCSTSSRRVGPASPSLARQALLRRVLPSHSKTEQTMSLNSCFPGFRRPTGQKPASVVGVLEQPCLPLSFLTSRQFGISPPATGEGESAVSPPSEYGQSYSRSSFPFAGPCMSTPGCSSGRLGLFCRSFGTQRVVQKRRHQMRILHPSQTPYVPCEQRPPPIPHSLTASSTVKRLLNNNTIAAKEAAKRINWDAYISHQRGVRWHPQGAWRVQFSRRNHERNFFVRCECYFRVGIYGFQMAKDLAIRYRRRLEKEWEELEEQWMKLDILEAEQRAKSRERKEERLLLGEDEPEDSQPRGKE